MSTPEGTAFISHLNVRCPIFKKATEGGRTLTVRSVVEWNSLGRRNVLKRTLLNNELQNQSNLYFS
jgi:hypothetical protein